MKKLEQGIVIVIDGVDGSGKETQTKLLRERLEAETYSVVTISFPRHGEPSAYLVDAYLRGDFGNDSTKVNPYVASTFYAADRFAYGPTMQKALAEGKIVIIDRYVTSNMAYQGCKFTDEAERQAFLQWEYDFEYSKGGLPIPTVSIILHLPTEVSIELINQRGLAKDIHEKDAVYLERSRKTYLEIARLFPNIALIECYQNKKLLTREQVHTLVWDQITPFLT